MSTHDTQPPGPAALQAHEHREVWDLIAWVAAGTASPEQHQQVQDHLPHCAHCRDELAQQQHIHRLMNDPAPTADEAAIQRGLDRLWAREHEASQPPSDAARTPAANDNGWRATRWLPLAVAAQAFALCVLGVLHWTSSHAPDYVTLSQPPALPTDAVLRLALDEKVPIAELRQLLKRHELRIVGIDDDASSLLLAPSRPDAVRTTADATALAARLRAEPGVLLSEPVGRVATGR